MQAWDDLVDGIPRVMAMKEAIPSTAWQISSRFFSFTTTLCKTIPASHPTLWALT